MKAVIRERWVTEFWARLVANENDYGYFSETRRPPARKSHQLCGGHPQISWQRSEPPQDRSGGGVMQPGARPACSEKLAELN